MMAQGRMVTMVVTITRRVIAAVVMDGIAGSGLALRNHTHMLSRPLCLGLQMIGRVTPEAMVGIQPHLTLTPLHTIGLFKHSNHLANARAPTTDPCLIRYPLISMPADDIPKANILQKPEVHIIRISGHPLPGRRPIVSERFVDVEAYQHMSSLEL